MSEKRKSAPTQKAKEQGKEIDYYSVEKNIWRHIDTHPCDPKAYEALYSLLFGQIRNLAEKNAKLHAALWGALASGVAQNDTSDFRNLLRRTKELGLRLFDIDA